MAQIKPLRGLRFNKSVVGDITSVITPPYDVIDKKFQQELHEASPYNIIRLELGEKSPDDTPNDNVYTRAAALYRDWISQQVLVQEEKPALYLYQQEYQVYGVTKVRTGFICGIKAEDYAKGQVLPHEETLPKHKADRLELMRATEANFSPIFGLYSDAARTTDQALASAIKGKTPDIDVTDWNGEKHRIWVVTDEDAIKTVVSTLDQLKVFIADGHHRYETSVTYAKEMAEKGVANHDYMLITLVNLFDEGLVVLPTHRLVKNIKNFDQDTFLKQLQEFFEITSFPIKGSKEEALQHLLAEMSREGDSAHAFGLYLGDGQMYLLKLQNEELVEKETDPNKSHSWRHLDVTVLHTLVLEKILGIGAKERASEEFLTYTREDFFAIDALDRGECQISLLMNPTKVEEVTNVAGAGEKMPQKSTFFYPKVISGLVINKLD